MEETGENHWPVVSHWQTLSHDVVSSTPHLGRIRTQNASGDRHWLHSDLLGYPTGHMGGLNIIDNENPCKELVTVQNTQFIN